MRSSGVSCTRWPRRTTRILLGSVMYGRHGSEPLLHPCHTAVRAGKAESERCRCRPRPSSHGGTNVMSPPRAAGRATSTTGATLPSASGSSPRRSGLRCGHVRAVRGGLRPSGSCPHRDASLSLAPGLAEASRHTTPWNSGWPKDRSSPCPPSPWKGMPTGRRTRTPVPMPRNSRAHMRTG